MRVAATVFALLLAAAPLLAAPPRILMDRYDPRTNTGVAVVQMSETLIAEIVYRDMDRSQSFTPADTKLRVTYNKRLTGKGGTTLQPRRGN